MSFGNVRKNTDKLFCQIDYTLFQPIIWPHIRLVSSLVHRILRYEHDQSRQKGLYLYSMYKIPMSFGNVRKNTDKIFCQIDYTLFTPVIWPHIRLLSS